MQLSALKDLGITMCLDYKNLISKIFFSTEERNHGNYFSRFKYIITYSIPRDF